MIKRLLLIPHLKIHNANALSSPFTIGFPAMTAWLGATHALERHLKQGGFEDVLFKAMAVISHQCDLQTHKGIGDYVYSIIGTGNPLDKSGSRSAFIEEARCHLDISLVIEYTGVDMDDNDDFLDKVSHLLHAKMKMAGGDILNFNRLEVLKVDDRDDAELRRFTRCLMPGYVIVERRELMQEAMVDGLDAMDALIDYLAVHHHCEKDEKDNIHWSSKRKTGGWIVPIAIGFHGVDELKVAKNQRNTELPHRFAESLVTLGEFKMPHRIQSLDEILWHYHVNEEQALYMCQQNTQLN